MKMHRVSIWKPDRF